MVADAGVSQQLGCRLIIEVALERRSQDAFAPLKACFCRKCLIDNQPVVDPPALDIFAVQIIDCIVRKDYVIRQDEIVIVECSNRFGVAPGNHPGISTGQHRNQRGAWQIGIDAMLHTDDRIDILERCVLPHICFPYLQRIAADMDLNEAFLRRIEPHKYGGEMMHRQTIGPAVDWKQAQVSRCPAGRDGVRPWLAYHVSQLWQLYV